MMIRPATPADATPLAALSIEVWLSTYLSQGITQSFARFVLKEFTPSRFKALIAGSHLMVVGGEEGLEGFIQISENHPAPQDLASNTEIQKLYVRPARHRHGLGQALLTAALDQNPRMQDRTVWVATNSENTPAIAFYLRQGFRKAGITAFRLDGQSYPNTVFLREPDT